MQIVVPPSALLAGSLHKRSDWMRAWNTRFVVLTTEALVWHREPSPGALEEAKKRTIVLHSAMNLSVKDGLLQLQQPGQGTLVFRAADDDETQVWLDKLRGLLDTLKSEGRASRWHALSCSALHSAPPFLELPHIGSRNLRQRQLAKLFFSVRHTSKPGGASPGGTSGAAEEVLLYLMRLPPAAAAWSPAECRAFQELLANICTADHPFLMGMLHAELLPAMCAAPPPPPPTHALALLDAARYQQLCPSTRRPAAHARPHLL